jgi:predicted enzyme related to lactoylglutathione lyase
LAGTVEGNREKEMRIMLRGLATVSYWADDVEAAKAWYTRLLGIEPYFERSADGALAYVEFRIGDYQDELGLIDRRFAHQGPTAAPAGAVIYWHVDDVEAALATLREMGATGHEPLTNREAGFVTASVVDPFGNILGVMYNPHYLEILGDRN